MAHLTKSGQMAAQTSQSEQLPDHRYGVLYDVAETALTEAARRGAVMAAAGIEQDQGMSVTVRNGCVETVERNRDKSMAVTVYFAGGGGAGNHGGEPGDKPGDKPSGYRSGVASTTDFSAEAVRQCVHSACDIAKFTEADRCSGLAEQELLATEFPDLDLHHPWPLDMERAIAIAADCEGAALGHDPRISNTEGATLASHHGADLYATSGGFRGLTRSSRHSLDCAVITGQGDAMQRDYWYDSARDSGALAAPSAIGAQAARRTLNRIGARRARTTECPVLFPPGVSASLLSHLVAAVSGPSLYRRASFLLDHVGRRIFPAAVRIHEQPHLRKSPGGASFDGEGVATAPRDLVADGVLQGYVLSCYAARRLGLRSTAGAGGVRNLEIAPTEQADLAALIAQMGRGLVVSELIGYGVNIVTGDYSRGAFGFWVENGEIQYPVHECTIASNLTQIFSRIAAVGSDIDLRRNLRAGSILIEKMTLAGK